MQAGFGGHDVEVGHGRIGSATVAEWVAPGVHFAHVPAVPSLLLCGACCYTASEPIVSFA